MEEYIKSNQITNYAQNYIKTLEEENRRGDTVFNLIKQENANLKNELAGLKQSLKNLQKLNSEIIILNRTVIKDSQILEKENNDLKQSQKQLTIEVLEKVKNYFDDKECDDESDGWIITNRNVVEYVDNQIKELKGGNKNG